MNVAEHAAILENPNTFSGESRIKAVFQLLVDGSEDAITSLVHGLQNDPSPIVRHECAYSLGEIGGDVAQEALLRAMNADSNPFVVHEAALAASNAGYLRAQKILEELTGHPNRDVALTAVISLERLAMKTTGREINESEAEQIILNLLAHPEHRIQSAFRLMENGSDTAVETLIQALKQETDPIVKHEIVFSLGETASSVAEQALLEELKFDPNPFVLHETVLALGTLGNLSSESAIRSLLTHSNEDIVESAEIALERLLT